jgi:phenylacetate-CoA ligase
VVRRFAEVAEFRSTVIRGGSMRSLSVEIELASGSGDLEGTAARVSNDLREALGLTVPVRAVESGALPRYEMKARRFVVKD